MSASDDDDDDGDDNADGNDVFVLACIVRGGKENCWGTVNPGLY
jgi:hypothetical protein